MAQKEPSPGRWGPALGIGAATSFGGTVVAGLIVGYYLDGYLGTSPVLTLLLTVGSMVGAVYRLLWVLRKLESQKDGNGS